MKVYPECAQCLLRRILYETELGKADVEQQYRAMKLAIDALHRDFSPNICSAEIATGVHKEVYDLLGRDPYADAKAKSNEIALRLLPKARKMVEESDDPFRTAVLCSIIGNVLDFGIRNDFANAEVLLEKFDSLCAQGLGHDDIEEIKALAHGKIAYLTDNCGEIVFDRLLLEELGKMGAEITLVVRGEAILTDATMEDVDALEMRGLVDKVMSTEKFAVGIPFWDMPEELDKELRSADLIIAKGMANYETLSEMDYGPVAYLLRTKCRPVASSMGLKKDINAAKLYR
jgi:uncharacterized protein with ATP-grasp and redox domains